MKIESWRELFIVDNSEENRIVPRYLHHWTELASGFDIAIGFFEIGARLALEGKLPKLDRIRVPMGDELSARTRQALLERFRNQISSRLNKSIGAKIAAKDFLKGVAAVVDGIRSKKIECPICPAIRSNSFSIHRQKPQHRVFERLSRLVPLPQRSTYSELLCH